MGYWPRDPPDSYKDPDHWYGGSIWQHSSSDSWHCGDDKRLDHVNEGESHAGIRSRSRRGDKHGHDYEDNSKRAKIQYDPDNQQHVWWKSRGWLFYEPDLDTESDKSVGHRSSHAEISLR